METAKLVLTFFLALASSYLTLAKKPQCKFPAQWQSNIFLDFGMMLVVPGQANASGVLYYDYINRQIRVDLAGNYTQPRDTYWYDYTFIWQFNESAVYTIDHINNTCDRDAGIDGFWSQWQGVPLDASPESIGTITGKGGFHIKRYDLMRDVGGNAGNVSISLYVKVGHVCPPVRLSLSDPGLTPLGTYTYSYDFLDIGHIKDPDVFIPPPNCPKTTVSNEARKKSIIPKQLEWLFG